MNELKSCTIWFKFGLSYVSIILLIKFKYIYSHATYITKKSLHSTYNMVGSALFLQRALYTVHCTNTMHSRKPSFSITPAVFSQHCKSLFCNICGNEIRHTLLKQFHLITLDINTIQHPCISPCTLRNRDMFERRSVDSRTISVPFACAHSNVLCVAIVTSRSWMGLWRHCWRRQWLGRVHCIDWEWDLCLECPLRITSYFVLFS